MPPFKDRRGRRVEEVYVRLTCKLANSLDGIDVTDARVGDVLDLSAAKASMLIAEAWAEPVPPDEVIESRVILTRRQVENAG